jgi:hypothetical protein
MRRALRTSQAHQTRGRCPCKQPSSHWLTRCANHGDGGNADACGVLPVATGRPALAAAEGPIVTTLKSAGLGPTAGFLLGLSAVAAAGCGRAIGLEG